MKGTIEKINDNWMVILDQRTWQDPSAEDLILPLHIDDLWVIDHTSYILGKKQELNFQILTVEEGVTPCGTHLIYKDYAKLILKENHIVDTNEMICYTKQDVIDAIIKIHEIYSLHGQYNDTLEAKKLRLKGVSWHIQNILESLKKKIPTSSQTEISDEEIQNYVDNELKSDVTRWFFMEGAKWYREQLKKVKK